MDLKTLGAQIKQARKEEGLTQTQLGEKLGMPKENISRIEAGRQNISFNLLQSIAEALSRTINEQLLVKV
jgi:transcriptional regulator with XRE-family HTH domain